ncbi:MAG TPA: hypothetical protein VG937_39920 [Polyangiaceae bacterium]|nr:hypothetical protein [Polyangiaceae bacterium]
MRLHGVHRWVLGVAVALATATAGATDVTFRAPGQCDRAEGVREQIERLIGRPLREAKDADFPVNVERTGNEAWRATVRTTPRGSDTRESEREFTGKTCSEVSDAAAVAIAMAIEQHATEAATESPSASEGSKETETQGAPARAAVDAKAAEQPATPERRAVRAMIGLHGGIETGALPNPAPGAEFELSVGVGKFRGTLLGALTTPQTQVLADGKGGEFQLLLAGLLACGARPLGPLDGSGCLGFELGQIAAEGVGVRNPRIGNGPWRAARADLGIALPLTSGLSVTLRGALAVPLTRQTFVVNATERVFRPGAFSLRALVGLELEL